MNFKNLMAIAVVGALSVSLATPVFAQMKMGADAISERIALMKSNGGTLRGAGAATGADAIKVGETLVANSTALGDLWDKSSQTGETRALPAIWNEDGSLSEGFLAQYTGSLAAAEAVLVAANNGDAAAYGAALKVVGATCGACHTLYQAPKS